MPTWPQGLPLKPRLGAYASRRVPNVAHFETDTGPEIRRKRATATGTDIEAQMLLTAAQKAMLGQFFQDDCKDGALAFTMIDWETDVAETFTWSAAPAFRLRREGDLYDVTLNLRRSP